MNQESLSAFKQHFSGQIILPTDPGYKEASSVFMHTGAPAIIVRPKTAQDVVIAIQFVKDNKLVLSVRSGGHSGPGFGTNTDGAVIDMSHMKAIELIDAEKHIVRIQSGATWVEVATALQQHGLAISSGDTKTVGVGGLTLGGGIGWLVRKVGLAIDNLVAAEVVTADGKVVRASDSEHTDLFWAIRGGGGNFGIVTSFEFAAYPIGKVFAGPISYGIDEVGAVLRGWRDAMRVAPEELNSMIMVLPSFGGNPPAVMILSCSSNSDTAAAQEALAPLKTFGKVLMDGVKQKEYAEVLEDAHPPQGMEVVANNVFLKTFSDEVIAAIVEMCKSAIPILQIRALGGAMNRVAADSTAFPHRDSEVLLVCPTFLPIGAAPDVVDAAMKPWKTLAAFGSGAYANLLSAVTEENVRAAYPQATYERLAAIKKIYDPENIFNQNYNIKPN
jgi:hypothetical protein